jgi:hypothetical protein
MEVAGAYFRQQVLSSTASGIRFGNSSSQHSTSQLPHNPDAIARLLGKEQSGDNGISEVLPTIRSESRIAAYVRYIVTAWWIPWHIQEDLEASH